MFDQRRRFWVALRIFCSVTLGFLFLLSLSTCAHRPAHAHSWYDPSCCGDGDCNPVADTDVLELDDGSWEYLPEHIVFVKSRVKPSRDQQFHVCIGHSPYRTPYCIYVPRGDV